MTIKYVPDTSVDTVKKSLIGIRNKTVFFHYESELLCQGES